MKRRLLLTLSLLLFSAVGFEAWAYDFSAVSPSGHTLYYAISNGTASVVAHSHGNPDLYPNPYVADTYITGDVVIPDTVSYNGDIYTVVSIDQYAFFNWSSISTVTIPNTVTTIGRCAFQYCFSLVAVIIPNTVTSIGDNAFAYVKNIVYNGNATGSPWGAGYMNGYAESPLLFEDSTKSTLICCVYSATSVTIPSSVLQIHQGAFAGCNRLDTVNYLGNTLDWLSIDFADESANPLWYAHHLMINGNELTTLTIPNGLTSIKNYSFAGYTGLTKLIIPSSVTTIGSNAFERCTG